ncbi:MAG: hypothetical protein Q9182_004944 [Xanthomendoza sp. 2 TL-2023]
METLYQRAVPKNVRFTHLHHLLARKNSSSLRRKQSQSTNQTSSDQLSRDSKSSQYNNPDYEVRLEQKGSYMRKFTLGITDTSRDLCRSLLEEEQITPKDTLFRDDLFDVTCESVQGRNEALVVRDITPLICPSAQILRIYGAKHLNNLYETVNEGWNSMAELEGTLPQPDYSEQLNKLKPFVGEPGFKVITHFMATTRMYFPFLTCEVKCGAAALDFADRQNAQSMSVALRALVVGEDLRPLLRDRGRQDYFYHNPIRTFDFTEQDGREKWTTLKLVKNVYDYHSPKLHEMICSAIDDLPADINFDLSQSASFSQSTAQSSQQSIAESMLGEDNSQLSFLGSQEVTPSTSFTETNEPAFEKPTSQRAGGQRR